MLDIIKRLMTDEQGQGMTEYALILVLVVVAVIYALSLLGNSVYGIYSGVNNNIN